MRRTLICLSLLLHAYSSHASLIDRIEMYVVTNGQPFSPGVLFGVYAENLDEVGFWDYDLPFPTDENLPSAEEAAIWKADRIQSAEAARQAAKPLAQKQYENAFFDLIDTLLTLTGDPQDPTPKLGFPELQGLINQIQSTDPTTAVNLSLNLLTIDAALKRYDMMWWDNAVRHDLGE